MAQKKIYWITALIILFAYIITGCVNFQSGPTMSNTPLISGSSPILPTNPVIPTTTSYQRSPTQDLSRYAFPGSIDPAKQYMFYLHGKIIEDQGLPAISPDFGEYEYGAILEKLSGYGFVVISEQRPKDTDAANYAGKIIRQITILLDAGVPAKSITVLGASKGAAIAIYISHLLENDEVNFVIMAICHPDEVEYLKQNRIYLHGNILSVYDAGDEFAGSCRELFSMSEGEGISRQEEIVLDVGSGHGMLYKPMDEWVTPVVHWVGKP